MKTAAKSKLTTCLGFFRGWKRRSFNAETKSEHRITCDVVLEREREALYRSQNAIRVYTMKDGRIMHRSKQLQDVKHKRLNNSPHHFPYCEVLREFLRWLNSRPCFGGCFYCRWTALTVNTNAKTLLLLKRKKILSLKSGWKRKLKNSKSKIII